jgi:hypothetical protein
MYLDLETNDGRCENSKVVTKMISTWGKSTTKLYRVLN